MLYEPTTWMACMLVLAESNGTWMLARSRAWEEVVKWY